MSLQRIRERVVPWLKFRPWAVTVAAVVTYVVLYVAILVTDQPPSIPSNVEKYGVSLEQAYDDLHIIGGLPSPYNSHQNDFVHAYVLKRVKSAASNSSFVHVVEDKVSNVTYYQGKEGTYFEGTNILVRIDGKRTELPAVLFSAHYDSVSTAPGASDDGMGLATLLQLVDFFAKSQPSRTLVFHLNNGEEDGLHGAHAFLEHEWSKLPASFVNLEGGGVGGKPFLFRTTSTRLVKLYTKVPHPYRNSVFPDVFALGLIKSGTDYSVYHNAAMEGLDIAFYKRRSKYHTKDDSIPSLGGKGSLWSMLETVLFTAQAMAEDDGQGNDATPVFFDLFGSAMPVFPLSLLSIINILFLAFGPIVVGGLLYLANRKHKLYLTKIGWGRFPVAFVIGGALSALLAILYIYTNPFIIHSHPLTLLLSFLLASFLGQYVTLYGFSLVRPIQQQKLQVLIESYILWWILLLASTIIIFRFNMGALYVVTFSHAGIFGALLVGLLEDFELPAYREWFKRPAPTPSNGFEETPTERTPLIEQDGDLIEERDLDEGNQVALWIVQFLLAVPFPVILTAQLLILHVDGLGQTLGDGNSAVAPILGAAFLSVLCTLPITAFAHKVHKYASLTGLVVLIALLLFNVFVFPLSSEAPLKAWFHQSIDLDEGVHVTTLAAARPWLKNLMPEIPSSWNKDVPCRPWNNLEICSWSGIPPSVAEGDFSEWLTVNTTLETSGVGAISLTAVGSRNCKVIFDTPVNNIRVKGSSGKVQDAYPLPTDGIKVLQLWSRSWDRVFEVNVEWDGTGPLRGRGLCEWVEGGIPAYDEVVAFLPEWARVSKRAEGLLEGWKRFSM